MAYRGILPEVPSFGTQLARGLGGGLSAGIGKAMDLASQLAFERQKLKSQLEFIRQPTEKPFAGKDPVQQLKAAQLLQMDPNLHPEDIQELTKAKFQEQPKIEEDPFAEAERAAAVGLPEYARIATEKGKIAEKRKMAREEREFLPKKEYIEHAAKQNTQYLDKIKQISDDLPNTQFSLAMIEDALGDADKWAAAKDWMANRTGFPGFRSAAGVELDSAVKNYFLGDLSSIKGGRPNIFLEKQIRDAYMKAGQDPISNQKILLGMSMKEKINQLKVDKTRELENLYLKKQGYLPSGFESIVNKEIKTKVDSIEKNAIDTLHHLSKIEESRDKIFRTYLEPGETLMMDPDGNPFAVKKKEVSSYRELGYIPLGKK